MLLRVAPCRSGESGSTGAGWRSMAWIGVFSSMQSTTRARLRRDRAQ